MNVLITAKATTGDSKVTYTISSENNITAFATAKEAKSAPDVERFASAKELTKLAEQWPAARLVDIWNALPGVVPAKRFTSRKPAVVRVWASLSVRPTARSAGASFRSALTTPPPLVRPARRLLRRAVLHFGPDAVPRFPRTCGRPLPASLACRYSPAILGQ